MGEMENIELPYLDAIDFTASSAKAAKYLVIDCLKSEVQTQFLAALHLLTG